MTHKDQDLLAEAYMNEVFGFGKKPDLIDIKSHLDPEAFAIVTNVFHTNPKIRAYVQNCNLGACLIDKSKISKICDMLKAQYDSTDDSSPELDNIIDTHDALMQVITPTPNYNSRPTSKEPWGYKPVNN